MTELDPTRSSQDLEPEIAADDVGASAAAERLQKQHDAGNAGAEGRDEPPTGRGPASSGRERLAGSAVGLGGGGPNKAGGFSSADSEGSGVDELLIDGQEEVFSRTEIESGRIEHHTGEERPRTDTPPRP